VSFSPQSEETLSPRTVIIKDTGNSNNIGGSAVAAVGEKSASTFVHRNANVNCPGNRDEMVMILHQLRPIVRRFVVLMKDYSYFVDLCKEYMGSLDIRFVNAVSLRITSIEKEIGILIEGRWPDITSYMKHTFHRSLVELEIKAKEGTKGSVLDMSQQFQDTLRQCYTLVKMIRDSVLNNKEESNPQTGRSLKIKKSSSGIISSGKDKAVTGHQKNNNAQLPSKASLSSESEITKLTSTAGKPSAKSRRRKTDSIQRSRTLSSRQKNVKAPLHQQENIRHNTQPSVPIVCPEWRCFKCTVTNLKGDKCNMCGEPKPVMFRLPSITTLKDVEFDMKVNTKWICSCCKFVNSNSTLKRCQMCNQEKEDENLKGWTCTRCSLKNPGSLIKCNMCAKGRFSPNSRLRSVSSPGSQSPGKVGSSAAKHNQQPLRTVSNNSSCINRSLSSRRKIIPLSEANLRIH